MPTSIPDSSSATVIVPRVVEDRDPSMRGAATRKGERAALRTIETSRRQGPTVGDCNFWFVDGSWGTGREILYYDAITATS